MSGTGDGTSRPVRPAHRRCPGAGAGICSSPTTCPTSPSDAGYRGPTACRRPGITYRQLDYWARTGLVEPSVRPATGSGTQRLYSFRDILVLKVVKRLLDTGVSLQQIRTAVSTCASAASRTWPRSR